MRPGATFIDTHSGITYEYQGAANRFDHDILMELILQEAKDPVETLNEKVYFTFRTKSVELGEIFVINSRDFY